MPSDGSTQRNGCRSLDTIENDPAYPRSFATSPTAQTRLASLSQLAEEVMSRAADFQAQKESIEDGLVEATGHRAVGGVSASHEVDRQE
jgi:hypothetical protein